ncbi:MAG: aminotransferase class I/II-fold pyridoxal phosphate-dependent enzyme [Caldilineaceae bacterium]
MRERINTMRHLFVETLNEKGVDRDFSFIARQRGMFSFSGLNPEQVKALCATAMPSTSSARAASTWPG